MPKRINAYFHSKLTAKNSQGVEELLMSPDTYLNLARERGEIKRALGEVPHIVRRAHKRLTLVFTQEPSEEVLDAVARGYTNVDRASLEKEADKDRTWKIKSPLGYVDVFVKIYESETEADA